MSDACYAIFICVWLLITFTYYSNAHKCVYNEKGEKYKSWKKSNLLRQLSHVIYIYSTCTLCSFVKHIKEGNTWKGDEQRQNG